MRTIIRPMLIVTIFVAIVIAIVLPLKADISHLFILHTNYPDMAGFTSHQACTYVFSEDRKDYIVYDYDSQEVSNYSFDFPTSAIDFCGETVYILESYQYFNEVVMDVVREGTLWEIDQSDQKIAIGSGNWRGSSLHIDGDEVYMSTNWDDIMAYKEGNLRKFSLNPWVELYSTAIFDPGAILMSDEIMYVLDHEPEREIVDYGDGPVADGTWIQRIVALRKSSGTIIKEYYVKGGVTDYHIYGNDIVCAHGMYYEPGYTTISYIDTETGEISEYDYGTNEIKDSEIVDNMLIGTIRKRIGDTIESEATNKLILFDLTTREGEFRELSHAVNTIEYDSIYDYILIHPRDDPDIYVYTLDSILNG